MVTSTEAVHDGSGGSVVDDVSTVVEVVKVATTIESPETKDVIQNQILGGGGGRGGQRTDGETGRQVAGRQADRDRRADVPPLASSSWRRCSSGASLAAVLLDSQEACNKFINQLINQSVLGGQDRQSVRQSSVMTAINNNNTFNKSVKRLRTDKQEETDRWTGQMVNTVKRVCVTQTVTTDHTMCVCVCTSPQQGAPSVVDEVWFLSSL